MNYFRFQVLIELAAKNSIRYFGGSQAQQRCHLIRLLFPVITVYLATTFSASTWQRRSFLGQRLSVSRSVVSVSSGSCREATWEQFLIRCQDIWGGWVGVGRVMGYSEGQVRRHAGGARRVWQLRDTSAQLAAGSYWGQRMGARNVATVWSESGSSAKLFRQHPDTYTTHRLTNKLDTEKKINKKNANYWTWT